VQRRLDICFCREKRPPRSFARKGHIEAHSFDETTLVDVLLSALDKVVTA
jgi:hypothetical protein